MFIHSKEQEEVRRMQLHNIFIHSQWPFLVEITNKKWNSSYYIHNLEKAKNPRIQHARRDILHRGGGLSHQSMRAVLVGSTIWHTQYPQKMNLGVLNVWWMIVFQEKDIFLCILMEESAFISCMQIIIYNMLASNNISSNFRLHSLKKPTHQISHPSKFLPTLVTVSLPYTLSTWLLANHPCLDWWPPAKLYSS